MTVTLGPMRDHLRRWGAVYVLLVLFTGSWVGHLVTQAIEVGNEAREHGGTFEWGSFWPVFWRSTFENWQSEFLQLLTDAMLILALGHVLFAKQTEDQERLEAKVDAVLAELGVDFDAD